MIATTASSPRRAASISALLLLTISGTLACASRRPAMVDPFCSAAGVRTFTALEARSLELEAQRASGRADVHTRCEVAALQLKGGRFDEAEAELSAILEEDAGHVGANLLLAELFERSLRPDRAETLRERAARIAPGALPVRLLEAERLAAEAAADDPSEAGPEVAEGTAPAAQHAGPAAEPGREEVEGAADLFFEILLDHPDSPDALVAAAGALLRTEEPEEARRLLDRALELDHLHAPAHTLYARLHQQERETELSMASLHRAVAADSLLPAPRVALAGVLRNEGDLEGAFRHIEVVLRIDPYSESTYRSLGNGASVTSFGRYPPLDDDQVDPALAAALDRGDAHLLARELDEAETVFLEVLESHPTLAAARLGLGTVQYHRQEYESAFRWFRQVVEDHPDLGLASFGAAYSLRRIREDRDPDIEAALARFHARPLPPEPERIREVFPDYDRVDDETRKIILLSVDPLSHYIPVLAIAGATFQLLPFHKRLWELPYKETSRGRRTFDLRLWDDVKGQGGFHAVAGEEWLLDVMHGGFNVLAHEFMHQVHSLFVEEQRDEVSELFRLAKREERTLDSYADTNEQEYLAQAYEAFVSPSKRPDLGGTAGHTRDHLLELDSAVYALLERVNDRDSYRGNEIVAYRQRIRSLLGAGERDRAEEDARRALDTYGGDVDLLVALASTLRIRADHAGARELHEQAVALDPDRRLAYEQLAEDHALGWHDHAAAAAVMERFLERKPESIEGQLRLAGYRLAAGDLHGAEDALDLAASAIGESNPFESYFSLRGRIAFLRDEHEAAEESYRHGLQNISRSNLKAWTDLARIAMAAGDLERARSLVGTARGIDADAPLVREIHAVLLAAEGRTDEALERLYTLLEHDPARLETYTAIVPILREVAGSAAAPYIEAGLRLIEQARPVTFVYEDNRFRPRGGLSGLAIEEFRAVAEVEPTP